MNSEPLSLRRYAGAPCCSTAFCSQCNTSAAFIARSAHSTWHSRVYSSRIVSIFNVPPRTVASATHRNHVWTWDFIADATVRGGTLKMLTILDEYTRECHVLWAERAMKAADVLHWLQKAVEQHGAPAYLRSDNGSEFIAKVVQRWLKANQIKTLYIEPGSPWQNGFVESFHGGFRDECLNREQLWTLTESRVVVGDYRQKYN